MNLALVGTGQMGQAVERIARERGHRIVARFSSRRPFLDAPSGSLAEADVLVDFSRPDLALSHLERYADEHLRAVVGTTGWHDRLAHVEDRMRGSRGAVLHAPNFSLGVALLARAVQGVLPLLDRLPEFDAYVHEIHHTRKRDSPSGTALLLAGLLTGGLDRKDRVETETQHDLIDPAALHVSSTRVGGVFGHHTVGLDSPYDQIRLVHEAKSRDGFAFGAVRAAEWLASRQGLYTLDDVLDAWLG